MHLHLLHTAVGTLWLEWHARADLRLAGSTGQVSVQPPLTKLCDGVRTPSHTGSARALCGRTTYTSLCLHVHLNAGASCRPHTHPDCTRSNFTCCCLAAVALAAGVYYNARLGRTPPPRYNPFPI